jgi:Ca2+-binding RTX toxin-like protein
MTGTADPDILIGTSGDDLISGLAGGDILIGEDGNDILEGGTGNDFLRGGAGADTLNGGEHDDYLQGGEGDDILNGGAGFDRVAYLLLSTDPQVGVTLDLSKQGVSQNTGHGWDTLVNIEHASGTIYNDTIVGNGQANWIWGGASEGAGAGNDTLSGGAGNDLLEVGAGYHKLNGGADIDTVSFYSNGDIGAGGPTGVSVSLLLQGIGQSTYHGSMTLTGIENLSGSVVNDVLTGDVGNNLLAGVSGDDVLDGGDGNDILLGDGQIAVDVGTSGTSGPITRFDDVATREGDLTLAGDDIMNGGAGNDTLIGGYGDDTLNGGSGVNTLDGGAGLDTADYSDAIGRLFVDLVMNIGSRNDVTGEIGLGSDALSGIENVRGGDFIDVLRGSGENNRLEGGGGNDLLVGYGADDTLDGGAGDDVLRGGTGIDLIIGGDGLDTVSFLEPTATQAVYVDLDLQTVFNDGFGNREQLTSIERSGSGTVFADTFLGSSGANSFFGDTGDIIDGRAGDDRIFLSAAAASIEGGDGVDSIDGFAVNHIVDLNGDGVGETETATHGVFVHLGDGMIYDDGYGGGGTISGVENIAGGALDDLLFGDGGDNVIRGLAGDDVLRTGGGNDTLDGGEGDDQLRSGQGVDVLIGGEGFDRVGFYNLDATQGVIADLRTQTISNDGFGNAETMASIEALGGQTRFADLFYGDDQRNLFLAGGKDTVHGFGGDDDFQLDDAPSLIDGGEGTDSISGFTLTRLKDTNGDGLAEVQQATHGVLVDLQVGKILDDGFGSKGRLISIENVSGSSFQDNLTGSNGDNMLLGLEGGDAIFGARGNDTLDGGDGDDTLSGGDGDDLLYGGAGKDGLIGAAGRDTLNGGDSADVLNGGDGNDTLNGDGGADVLVGGLGNDSLNGGDSADRITGGLGKDLASGGAGADQFIYTSLADSTVSGGGQDTISDLTSIDLIDLSAIDANSLLADDQAFLLVATFSGVAGQMTLSLSGANTLVRMDVNGDGLADMAITLSGDHLAFSHFVL